MVEYIVSKAALCLISIASSTVNFGIAFFGIIVIINGYKKVRLRDMVLAAFITSVIHVIPQFILEYIFFHPNIIPKYIDGLILFPNPTYLFPYYFIMTKVMKIPDETAVGFLEETVCSQYIILLIFRMYSGLCGFFFGGWAHANPIFNIDTLSMAAVLITVCLILFAISRINSKHPPGSYMTNVFTCENIRREFAWNFLMALCNYALIALLCVLLLSERRLTIGLNEAVIYLVMSLIFAYRMVDNIRKRRLNDLEWQEKINDKYIKSLLSFSDEFRSIRHDWNNILQVYGGYITVADMEGLQKYHESVVKMAVTTQRNFELISGLARRKALYSIMKLKLATAEQREVRFDIGSLDRLVDVGIDDLDLCRILSNLLDNAIEAAVETDEKQLLMHCDTYNNIVVLKICNSAKNHMDVRHIGREGSTTKSNHSGLGLSIVRRILSAYEGCYMLMDYQDGYFNAYLTLKAG